MFHWLKRLFGKAPDSNPDSKKEERKAQQKQPENISKSPLVRKKSDPEKNSESLLEYLRLKSQKTDIRQNKFNLNNVLNELSGVLSRDFSGSGVELVFNIDNNVSKSLIGDSLQIGKILTSLIRALMQNDLSTEIELKISETASMGTSKRLLFRIIDTKVHLSEEEIGAFSIPYYDETLKKYIKLEFFVTKEIVSLMGGALDIKSDEKEGTVMTLNVPFKCQEKEERRKYRLPSEKLLGKKVFLMDSSYTSALAIKKMLSYFRYEVQILTVEHFLGGEVGALSPGDMVIFDEELLSEQFIARIQKLKQHNGIKVVLLSSIFRSSEEVDRHGTLDVVDAMADKPFSQERVFEMILDVERASAREKSTASLGAIQGQSKMDVGKVHRSLFEKISDITPERFSDFSGHSLLVVDDNRINQKILQHVLAKSGMKISVANDGKEAVNTVLNGTAHFDMVLMDINMPIMDGYTATAMIRKEEAYRKMPIVALTTLISGSEIEKMFAHGISGYMSKPLEVGRLYSAFDYFLKRSTQVHAPIEREEKIIQRFDGLDTVQGIRYANGNAVVYMEILKEFMSVYGQSPQMMRNLADDRNYAQMKILCGDMRSLSSAIGASKVHTVADEIYKLFLYGNEQRVPQYIEAYRREFEKLAYAIEMYLKRSVR